MKKYLLILFSTFITLDIFAWEYNPYGDYSDVINAYQYNDLRLSFCRYVPLFRPSTISRTCNHLQISSYPAETYYGEYVKATENPTETVNAYYDSRGNLLRIIRNTEDFRLQYNDDGILVGFKQYDINTGKLIQERSQKVPITTSRDDYFLVENHGKYWYILHPGGYVYNGGYMATFDMAFEHSNRGNDMNVIVKGMEWRNSDWLKGNSTSKWKEKHNAFWNQHAIFEKTTPSKWKCDFPSHHDVFNGIGLLKRKNGINPSNVLSHGVYENVFYEYKWM